MNAINQIIIEGNVVRPPVLKETPNGKKVCTVPLAVNHYYKDNSGKYVDEVGYFDIETWGDKLAPSIEKNALQGRGIRVIGRLKQDRWKDSDGKSCSKIKIVAEHIDFKPFKKGEAKEEDLDSARRDLETAAAGVVQETIAEETVF